MKRRMRTRRSRKSIRENGQRTDGNVEEVEGQASDGAGEGGDGADDGDDLGSPGQLGLDLPRENVEPEADDELRRGHPEKMVSDWSGGEEEAQGTHAARPPPSDPPSARRLGYRGRE